MISSNDIRQTFFSTTSQEEGYDPAQVQKFLDDVAATLERLESGYTTAANGARLLEPKDLLKQRFLGTKFRSGYNKTEVEDLIVKARETLSEYVQLAVAGKLPAPTEATAPPAEAERPRVPSDTVPSGSGPTDTGWLRDDIVATPAVPTQAVPMRSVPTQNPIPAAVKPPAEPAPAGMRGGDALRELQYTRATMFGDARETLTVRTPDGAAYGVDRIERTDNGVVIHLR